VHCSQEQRACAPQRTGRRANGVAGSPAGSPPYLLLQYGLYSSATEEGGALLQYGLQYGLVALLKRVGPPPYLLLQYGPVALVKRGSGQRGDSTPPRKERSKCGSLPEHLWVW
jgi:hypothetical protein